jgi:uncharacterized membrane protein
MQLNFLWLLTIVILPFPTEMVGGFDRDLFTTVFYIGTIFLNSLCHTFMVVIVRRNEAIHVSPESISDRWLINAVGSTIALGIALIVAAFVPPVGYFALLLLFLPSWVARWWHPLKRQPRT